MVVDFETRVLRNINRMASGAYGMDSDTLYKKAQQNVINQLKGTSLSYLIPKQLLPTPTDPLGAAKAEKAAQKARAQEMADARTVRRQGGWNPLGFMNPTIAKKDYLPTMKASSMMAQPKIIADPTQTAMPDMGSTKTLAGLEKLGNIVKTYNTVKWGGVAAAGLLAGGLLGTKKLASTSMGKRAIAYAGAKALIPEVVSNNNMANDNYMGYGPGFDMGDILQIALPSFMEPMVGLGKPKKKYRRMNYGNIKASSRAIRRVKGTIKHLRKLEKQLPKRKATKTCSTRRKC